MIQKVVTTQNTNLELSVLLPDNYIGKHLNVLIYAEDEINNLIMPKQQKKKPSDFFGTLSLEDAENLQQYVNKSRKEWERDF